MPDRIEFDLSADKKEIAQGETANVTVDGRFLYGAPAAGLALEGESTLSTARDWDRFKGFSFGLADEQSAEPSVTPLTGLPVVGEDGKATFPVSVDQLPSTTKLVDAKVTVRMRETGGRAVERSLDHRRPPARRRDRHPAGFRRRRGAARRHGQIQPDRRRSRRQARSAEGRAVVAGQGRAQLSMVPLSNSWNYEPVDLHQVGGQRPGRPQRRWRRRPCRCRSTGAATGWRSRPPIRTARRPAIEFDAGWYVSSTSTETPDGLEIALDKDTYAAGEVAKLQSLAALCRRTAGYHRRRQTAEDRHRHGAGRRQRPSTSRSATTGAPAPTSPRRCSGRAMRRKRACRRAPSASNG